LRGEAARANLLIGKDKEVIMPESNPGASPKSNRYFYTDPLAAAWMFKHFGMVLECWHTQEEQDEMSAPAAYDFRDASVEDGGIDVWGDVIHADCRRAYIHPDSLHLLEPQMGDLVWMEATHKSGMGVCRWAEFLQGDFESYIESLASDYLSHRIIQRNGIAFHWPEREAA
jgi:hypothetical protein